MRRGWHGRCMASMDRAMLAESGRMAGMLARMARCRARGRMMDSIWCMRQTVNTRGAHVAPGGTLAACRLRRIGGPCDPVPPARAMPDHGRPHAVPGRSADRLGWYELSAPWHRVKIF